MPLIEISPELKEEIREWTRSLIPDVVKPLEDLREKIRKEVGDIWSDAIIATVDGIISAIVWSIEKLGYLVGYIEAEKELGKQDAFAEVRPKLLPPDVLLDLYHRRQADRSLLDSELAKQGFSDVRIDAIIEQSYKLLQLSEIREAYLRNRISYAEAEEYLDKLGFKEDAREIILDTTRTFLNPTEVVSLWLRGQMTDSEVEEYLLQLGFGSLDIERIMKLAYYIPPVQDLVRMAVREVFTPEIAKKFGLFEDYPEEFEKYAAMQGISPFWATNYWAAHWELPSATMGFEMLHRGIINEEELKMLLRALDVMPFWREKLIKLSYNPLTRVDVRRMYRLGVIDRDEVYRAYLDLGYNPENAERLTKFTEVEALEEERELSKSELMNAYEYGIINEEELREYLALLKYPSESIDILVAMIEFKKEKKIQDSRIKAVKMRYLTDIITLSDVAKELTMLALSATEIDTYIQTWEAEKKSKVKQLTLTDLKTAYRQGVITDETMRRKMKQLGYGDEDIEIMLKSLKLPPV